MTENQPELFSNDSDEICFQKPLDIAKDLNDEMTKFRQETLAQTQEITDWINSVNTPSDDNMNVTDELENINANFEKPISVKRSATLPINESNRGSDILVSTETHGIRERLDELSTSISQIRQDMEEQSTIHNKALNEIIGMLNESQYTMEQRALLNEREWKIVGGVVVVFAGALLIGKLLNRR